ncbi:hypothetical protein [Streptoalloteichus hindustanus]|uniref:hypothetical protein n=1 Tax=Streptoalloteichus hindustanus TaxID=2017 RepID=UPI0013566231|nr:hypothetical protein [Streptoalloteichus hindustanus]
MSWTGAEVFTSARPRRPHRRRLLLAALLVLAAGAGGAWWWRGYEPASATPSSASTPQAAVEPRGEIEVDRLPTLPGVRLDGGMLSPVEAKRRNLLNDLEVELLNAHGSTRVAYAGSADNGALYAVLVFNTNSSDKAEKLASDLREFHRRGGLTPVEQSGLPTEVSVTRLVAADRTLYRATYLSGNAVVRIGVSRAGGEEPALAEALRRTARQALEAMPAR